MLWVVILVRAVIRTEVEHGKRGRRTLISHAQATTSLGRADIVLYVAYVRTILSVDNGDKNSDMKRKDGEKDEALTHDAIS